ncbi:hypothetical protein [Phenylobacterium sp.]|uniref:hypothetical protein n=1 Tax=Phenylobacterium sp. TaxID=1871053 RepID=UPI0025FBF6C5|nr:hypothetical protein [Phenylobacterium sp.]
MRCVAPFVVLAVASVLPVAAYAGHRARPPAAPAPSAARTGAAAAVMGPLDAALAGAPATVGGGSKSAAGDGLTVSTASGRPGALTKGNLDVAPRSIPLPAMDVAVRSGPRP